MAAKTQLATIAPKIIPVTASNSTFSLGEFVTIEEMKDIMINWYVEATFPDEFEDESTANEEVTYALEAFLDGECHEGTNVDFIHISEFHQVYCHLMAETCNYDDFIEEEEDDGTTLTGRVINQMLDRLTQEQKRLGIK